MFFLGNADTYNSRIAVHIDAKNGIFCLRCHGVFALHIGNWGDFRVMRLIRVNELCGPYFVSSRSSAALMESKSLIVSGTSMFLKNFASSDDSPQ